MIPGLNLSDEPWRADAVCQGMNPDVFYPTRGDNDGMKRAKRICSSCPVSAECLDFALRNAEKFGVWGGLSERERRKIRRRRAADVVIEAGEAA